MKLNYHTEIKCKTQIAEKKCVEYAVNALKRDLRNVCTETKESGDEIWLVENKCFQETYTLKAEEDHLEVKAGDELGFIYGLFRISKEILGIQEFWFWNDQQPEKRNDYKIKENWEIHSASYPVIYRGWFINDEVLLHTWHLDCQKDKPWEMVFETLLRCGGNMVIPGTDTNSKKYRKLASDMGLTITHHHAEPLGAEMFARAYPDLLPSYEKYPEKFQKLWRDGIQEQKDSKVLWNIGFRGQGDCPFWVNDPKYETEEARGELMSRLMRMQYDMVKEEIPDAVCCTNLYGETMDLYQKGCLKIPEDVIKIWADNGYGKMVTRRQENYNPRIPALPDEKGKGHHGIYYHASFYDLQAANHMTMLPNSPDFVVSELQKAMRCACSDYWIINSSNIKPHTYMLDLIRKMWTDGSVDVEKHRKEYLQAYFGDAYSEELDEIWKMYPDYAVSYGPNEDEHAGEQFVNHPVRMLVSQYMRDKTTFCEDMLWAVNRKNLKEQIEWYTDLCHDGAARYEEYLDKCEKVAAEMKDPAAKRLFKDSLLLQVKIYAYCFKGAFLAGKSLLHAFDENYQLAFYQAGVAAESYRKADQEMRNREHGKWHEFYKNECLTDIKQTAWVLKGLMSYLRNLDDGPHFYKWQREFLYSEQDRKVMLVMNMENHLNDEEIFQLMETRFGR